MVSTRFQLTIQEFKESRRCFFPPRHPQRSGYTGMESTVVNQQQQPVPGQVVTVVVQERKPNACRAAIPSLHIVAAVICLVLNIFLPGIGTIVAGFSVFCCGNPGQSGGGKFGTFCLNFWVGVLQLLTCWIFLIGWVWSIMWGAAFIGLSADYHTPTETTTVVTSTPAAPVAGQAVVMTQQGVYPPGTVHVSPYPAGQVTTDQPQPPHYDVEKQPLEQKELIQSIDASFTAKTGPPPVQ
ncbi:protein SPEC3-like [Acanthaster planci]|uniref:Protein SPEC3-like n=1 Tax=Acanthaster planci TaxID=133434 RepID=A0A8B7ZDW4_ACAPL|nr:protein SPEC3-like [Acanthaster planci]XP_022101396.1 protein SPEC3-like [Acanthaster planci]XP_022101397.1 protein SPEC3-like [Acanthaster planci]XP_022101398.1 protein SPEC3-like [Acanthaster planci]XP_022101399.1 protein SPEC3-like [Acanthaster planci]